MKSIRIGEKDDAVYWLAVLMEGGEPYKAIARRLMIESQESGYGPEPAQYAAAVWQIIQAGDRQASNALFQLTCYLAESTKWYEDPVRILDNEMWFEAVREVRKVSCGDAEGRAIPHYALDGHTRRGKALVRSGEADERFSGTWSGNYLQMAMAMQNGSLSPTHEIDVEAYLAGYEQRLKARTLRLAVLREAYEKFRSATYDPSNKEQP